VLREELGSETLSYIQLAIYAMNKAKTSQAPLLELQAVVDHILAFWGICDDVIDDDVIRSIIKAGKRVERMDLYARLHMDRALLRREFDKLRSRLERSGLPYDRDAYQKLSSMIEAESELDYERVLCAVDHLIEA
jgi:uncharacterized alpha-E superfamily protein